MAKSLQKFDPSMSCKQVPSLADLIKSQAPPYRFEASWHDLKDDRCLILHSSGSTGTAMISPDFAARLRLINIANYRSTKARVSHPLHIFLHR
jgi:hypothetical protein